MREYGYKTEKVIQCISFSYGSLKFCLIRLKTVWQILDSIKIVEAIETGIK